MNDITKYDPNYNYIEKEKYKDQSTYRPALNPEPDTNRWEIDLKEEIDKLWHYFIGEIEVDGVWVKANSFSKRMNDKGANVLLSPLYALLDKGTFLSDLTQEEINYFCLTIGENTADLITDNYRQFEISPQEAEMRAICDTIVNKLNVCFNMAKGAQTADRRKSTKFANPTSFSHTTMGGMPQNDGGGI